MNDQTQTVFISEKSSHSLSSYRKPVWLAPALCFAVWVSILEAHAQIPPTSTLPITQKPNPCAMIIAYHQAISLLVCQLLNNKKKCRLLMSWFWRRSSSRFLLRHVVSVYSTWDNTLCHPQIIVLSQVLVVRVMLC